jgi:GTPase SAR1 family protein
MKGADLSMIMYDISNRESFNKIAYWFELLKKQNGKNVPGALVATKSDLKGIRQVEMAEGHELAKKLNMEFFEVSAVLYFY